MSFVDHIVQSAPQGSNPYAFAAEYVATIIPPKPHWYFSSLIAVGVIAAINLILTFVSIIVMRRRSRAGTGVGLWFFKTQYGHSSGIPYIVPNALTMFLFWNLVFMLLMQPYIWLNYVAYHSVNMGVLTQMYFWYGFVFIWDSIGMWTSAFGTLYATLLPKLSTTVPSTRNVFQKLLLHPITLNTLCFFPPLGLAITQIVTSTYSSVAWSNVVQTQSKLVGDLTILGSQWAVGGSNTLDQGLLDESIELGDLFLKQKDVSQTAFQRNAGTCVGWYLLCIILFAPTAVWLLCVIRSTMRLRARHVVPQPRYLIEQADSYETSPTATNDSVVQQRDASRPLSPVCVSSHSRTTKPSGVKNSLARNKPTNKQQDENLQELRRALYTVGLQSTATLLCMASTAGAWLWICVDAARVIITPNLHALAIVYNIWVFAVVGCLVNIFVLIRTHRTSTGSTQHSSAHTIPMSPMRLQTHTISLNGSTPVDLNQHDRERKSVFIHATTTTHTVVDSLSHRSIASESECDMKLARPHDPASNGSSYSLSLSGQDDQQKITDDYV